MSQPKFRPGDIVLIPYAPYTNYSATKPRPALVLSSSQFNSSGPDVILAPLSSNIRAHDPKQIIIKDTDAHFPQTKLRQSSAVKCGAIFTYCQAQIARKLGTLHPDILNHIRQLIVTFLTDN